MLYKVYNHSTLAEFNNFSIIYYGLYFSIGFLLFLCSYWFLAQTLGVTLSAAFFWSTSLAFSLSFVFGTKLLRILKSREKFMSDPLSVLKRNGNSFYGGVFGFVLASYILAQQQFSLSFLQSLDMVAISFPVFQIFIRLGCASYGCCFGKPCDGKNCVSYNDIHAPAYKLHGARPLLPTQSYSVYKNIFLLIVLYVVFFSAPYPGLSVVVWCVTYSLLRFLIDYTRDNTNKKTRYGLRKSQQISILVFLIGVDLSVFVKDEPYLLNVNFDLFFRELISLNSIMALMVTFIIFFLSFAISLIITKEKSV